MSNSNITNTTDINQTPVVTDNTPTQPIAPTEAPPPFHSCSWLMALMNAMSKATDAQYAQESADADTLIMNQKYQSNIATSWNTIISNYMKAHPDMNPSDVTQVGIYQTNMANNGNAADSTTHGSQSILETDVNNLAKIVDLLSGATTITAFTANCLR